MHGNDLLQAEVLRECLLQKDLLLKRAPQFCIEGFQFRWIGQLDDVVDQARLYIFARGGELKYCFGARITSHGSLELNVLNIERHFTYDNFIDLTSQKSVFNEHRSY